jgi:Calcineurin-like phosphoesterase
MCKFSSRMYGYSCVVPKAGYYMVMHLGDVYYSGDGGEMKARFLDVWPKAQGAISRGLNGNHEMYTGGKAYFDAALKQFGQPASYFALQNNHWLLAGLDTAYADHDLAGDQASWLTNLIAQAGDRRVVLSSHHQPFSLMDVQGPKLVQKLQPHLATGRIYAWYWGHEHHCVVYDGHPAWRLRGPLHRSFRLPRIPQVGLGHRPGAARLASSGPDRRLARGFCPGWSK